MDPNAVNAAIAAGRNPQGQDDATTPGSVYPSNSVPPQVMDWAYDEDEDRKKRYKGADAVLDPKALTKPPETVTPAKGDKSGGVDKIYRFNDGTVIRTRSTADGQEYVVQNGKSRDPQQTQAYQKLLTQHATAGKTDSLGSYYQTLTDKQNADQKYATTHGGLTPSEHSADQRAQSADQRQQEMGQHYTREDALNQNKFNEDQTWHKIQAEIEKGNLDLNRFKTMLEKTKNENDVRLQQAGLDVRNREADISLYGHDLSANTATRGQDLNYDAAMAGHRMGLAGTMGQLAQQGADAMLPYTVSPAASRNITKSLNDMSKSALDTSPGPTYENDAMPISKMGASNPLTAGARGVMEGLGLMNHPEMLTQLSQMLAQRGNSLAIQHMGQAPQYGSFTPNPAVPNGWGVAPGQPQSPGGVGMAPDPANNLGRNQI